MMIFNDIRGDIAEPNELLNHVSLSDPVHREATADSRRRGGFDHPHLLPLPSRTSICISRLRPSQYHQNIIRTAKN